MNVNLTTVQIELIVKELEGAIAAHHNWIASAVDSANKMYGTTGKTGYAYASELVVKLQQLQTTAAMFRTALREESETREAKAKAQAEFNKRDKRADLPIDAMVDGGNKA